jgi:hypothetical protein
MKMPTAEEFQKELDARFRLAADAGAPNIEINSGELHRKLGGYPQAGHQMPTCCNVMYREQRLGDAVVSAPPKGKGASLTIRYRLPR